MVGHIVESLQRFMREQMKIIARARGYRTDELSISEFAKIVGVAQSTMSKALDPANPSAPGHDFMIKLARATQTDIRDLVAMISPDDVLSGSSSDVISLATRIDKLSADQRQLIDKLISGTLS
jgi:predicted transcriptional regulator